jgi:hypothetical protein
LLQQLFLWRSVAPMRSPVVIASEASMVKARFSYNHRLASKATLMAGLYRVGTDGPVCRRGNVEIEVPIEEGSLIARVTVAGAILLGA